MSSPGASSLSAPGSPSSDRHPHHPSYKTLLFRLFRQPGQPRTLHLATIRSLFAKSFLEKYWFPESWARNVYQRLRGMEREGVVISSGPHQLYFSPTARGTRAASKRRTGATRAPKRRSPGRTQRRSETGVVELDIELESLKSMSPKITEECPVQLSNQYSDYSTELMAIEECLEAFKPLEEIREIEGRLAAQVNLVVRLLTAIREGDMESLSIIREQAEHRIFDESTSVQSLQNHINSLESEISQIQTRGVYMSDDLSGVLQHLTAYLADVAKVQNLTLPESLINLSTLIASLTGTVGVLEQQLTERDQHEENLRSIVNALEADLSKSKEQLRLREEQMVINMKQLDVLKSAEDSIANAAETIHSELSRATIRFEHELEQQMLLHEGDKAHYESIISALRAQMEEQCNLAQMEHKETEKQLSEAMEQVKLLSMRSYELQSELGEASGKLEEYEIILEEKNKQNDELDSRFSTLFEHTKHIQSDIDSAKWHLDHIIDYMKE